MMVNLSLSKEELDVLYYALKRYSLDERRIADRFQKFAETYGWANKIFIEGRLKESAIADKLCNDCINLMLDMIKH